MTERQEALAIVREYVKNENLVRHMLAVEACMAFYANKYGEDEQLWRVAGLLHDFDWEIHPDLNGHPQDGAPMLRERGVPEEIIQIVLSHADHTGVPRDTLVRKALAACDEITGLVTACTLVRPSKSIHDLTVKSVKKKWNARQFAAGANREEIEAACADMGIDTWEHVGNVITAMQTVADELGLAGSE